MPQITAFRRSKENLKTYPKMERKLEWKNRVARLIVEVQHETEILVHIQQESSIQVRMKTKCSLFMSNPTYY